MDQIIQADAPANLTYHEQLAQAVADMQEAVDLAKQVIKKYDAIKAELASISEGPSDASICYVGRDHEVHLGPRALKRTVTPQGLRAIHAILGDDIFYGKASIPLSAVDALLNEEERHKVVEEERTGNRSVTVRKRG